jgi:predicted helicase
MQINEYLKQVKSRFSTGISTEHSYRADLQNLLNKMVKGITVTNEPKRQKCGAPDYIIQKKEVPLGYIEAKDIGIDLNRIEKSDQMKRYLSSLDNLILTDYLEFRFYKYGKKVKEIKIASIENGKIKTHTDFFESFSTHILDFCEFKGQTIKSAEKLAKMMAQKARMMEEVLFNAVKEEDENNTLQNQLKAFRQILIHDLDEKTFSDIYAPARLHDKTLEDFSRQEARDLIPKSNPFLRNLFDYISGAQLDDRVVWIVDDLADILRAADLKSILADFGKTTGQNDPFLHFYETFLAEYDPKLRRSRGVYYTPEPVVNFIVRAVDDILEEEFNLPQGLADISKVKIKKVVEGTAVSKGKNKGTDIFEEVEVHKVQILDPATGTGTFLSETIKQIYQKFKGQEGLWSSYVEDHLIPRINGFEILMASYTMCHLKIEMLLRETGYKPKDEKNQKRLKVFLTNSLEEAHPNTGTLFASWLSKEATEANHVKRDTPLMVVIGNPPYWKSTV